MQTYGDHHDVIKLDTFPGPEECEAQMRAKSEEQTEKNAAKRGRFRRRSSSKTEA